MAISITLTLPDEIFNLAQSLAHSINRDLNDILVEAIAFSISPNYQGEKISSLKTLVIDANLSNKLVKEVSRIK